MAKQTFTTGQVLTAAQMTSLQSTAMLGGSANAQTASYVLVAGDAGRCVTMNNAGATTITVNTGLFAAGDTVTILNIGAGTTTITAGTATVVKPANATLALVTNAGGVLYFTATGAATFMPFDVGSGAAAFVGCSLTRTGAQTLTTATITNITFGNEDFDTDGFHSTSSNTDRITIPSGKDGKYLVTFTIVYAPNSTGLRGGFIGKNGSTTYYPVALPTTSATWRASGSIILNLVATDYITLQGYQDSGGNLDVFGGADGTRFACQYLGA